MSYECRAASASGAPRTATPCASLHEGGYELDRKGNGWYEGEGWRLGPRSKVELHHHGKPVALAVLSERLVIIPVTQNS